MDQNTIVSVGAFCENILQDPTFQFLCVYFEQNAVGELLSTKPEDKELRERIYARVSAHREFLSVMADFVKQRAELTEPKDQPDEIDNPAVHNIYEGLID